MPQPAFPTETEIYILPSGEVIIADLPAELQPMTARLGDDAPAATQIRLDDLIATPSNTDQTPIPTDY